MARYRTASTVTAWPGTVRFSMADLVDTPKALPVCAGPHAGGRLIAGSDEDCSVRRGAHRIIDVLQVIVEVTGTGMGTPCGVLGGAGGEYKIGEGVWRVYDGVRQCMVVHICKVRQWMVRTCRAGGGMRRCRVVCGVAW